jgi:hypothetical protein
VGRLDGGGGSPPRPITPAPCYRCRCCGVTARAPSFRPRCRGSFLLTCFSSGHACQRVTEQGIHPADEQSQTSSRPVTAMMRFPPAGYFGSGRLQPLFTGSVHGSRNIPCVTCALVCSLVPLVGSTRSKANLKLRTNKEWQSKRSSREYFNKH